MPFAAAVFAAGQTQVGAQDPKELPLAIDAHAHRLAIELELNGFFHRGSPLLKKTTGQWMSAARSAEAANQGGIIMGIPKRSKSVLEAQLSQRRQRLLHGNPGSPHYEGRLGDHEHVR